MMLVTVLCSFSVLFGKCFLKKTQHESLYYLSRKWLNSLLAYVTTSLDSLCCYRLDFREKLIEAMLQGGGYANAPGLETESAVNFFHKRPKFRIIPLLGKKVLSRNHSQMNKALTQIAAELGGIA